MTDTTSRSFSFVPLVTSDPIYGEVCLPEWVSPLLVSPAVQRLRRVALSNVPSLSYPMIAGVSRYAHSIGVAYLAHRIAPRLGLSSEEHKTLICAALLHDAGIPPLGHLTEESFDLCGYPIDHEDTLRSVILEQGRIFSQMPHGENIGVSRALSQVNVDSLKVFEAILGRNELGRLLKSDIDIDNIDNIVRIYRLTGTDVGYDPLDVAMSVFVFGEDLARVEWRDVRYRLYSKLMFSSHDFAIKATTKRNICLYLRKRLRDYAGTNLPGSKLLQELLFHDDYQLRAQICLQLVGISLTIGLIV